MQTEVTDQRELRRKSLQRLREAQSVWAKVPLKGRLKIIKSVRHGLAARAASFVESIRLSHRRNAAETLAAELIPLADACRFLELEASRILQRERPSRRRRPTWLRGVDLQLHREPLGVVLILGASNYPLFLPGVQTLQALVAGNGVLLKPGRGATAPTLALVRLLVESGLDPALVQVLPEDPHEAQQMIELGVDKVVLTGSAESGRAVQRQLAETLTPSTMELSGCDAVFVLESADLSRVAKSLAFGLNFNSSATCIAPRRVFVPAEFAEELADRLRTELKSSDWVPDYDQLTDPAWCRAAELVADSLSDDVHCLVGGVTDVNLSLSPTLLGPTVIWNADPTSPLLRSDLFAPVLSLIPVATLDAALRLNQLCPYALGATIFGEEAAAQDAARRVDAGCVVINDILVPTADPRLPFGGRKRSGFGSTRGAEGLREMTRVKAIATRRGRWLPHLDPPSPYDADLLRGFMQLSHLATWRQRIGAVRHILQAIRGQRAGAVAKPHHLINHSETKESHPESRIRVIERALRLAPDF